METITTQTSNGSTPVVEDNPGSKYPFASATLTDEQLASIIAKLDELKGMLPPMPDLTPIERRRMSKLGIKSRGFADLALEAAKADPGLLPQSISLDTFIGQDELLRDLSLVQTHVASLKSRLDDALLLVGNYIYGASRTVYALTKTPAAQAKLQEQKAAMKLRFAKKKNQPAAVGQPQS